MERFAIVTGATGPVGRDMAQILLDRGFCVVVDGTPSHDLERVAEELVEEGGELIVVPGHVVDPEHRRELIDWVYDMGQGRLDVLVNYQPPPDREWPPSMLWRWVGLLEHHMKGFLATTNLLQRSLQALESTGGLVINVSSDAVDGYGICSRNLETATQLLAPELRERGVGVVFVDSGEERRGPRPLVVPERPEASPLPSWEWLLEQQPPELAGRSFSASGT